MNNFLVLELQSSMGHQELTDVLTHTNVPIALEDESKLDKVLPYSKVKRRLMLLLIGFAGLLAPLTSTIYFPSVESIIRELKTTSVLMDVSISVFMAMLGVFPLVWGGLSDRYSRKWVLIVALIFFLGSNVGAALSEDITTLIIMRIIQGIGSSAPIVVGIGIVTDIFPKEELGSAISFFMVGTLVGPVLGPIFGGILDELFGWRSVFWCLSIVSGIILLLIVFLLPETLPETSKQPLPYKFLNRRLKRNGPTFNPLFPLIFLKYPVVILASLVGAITFGTFFGVESFQSRAMDRVYQLSPLIVGLTFLVLGAGSILGNLFGGKMSDFMYQRASKKGSFEPEVRLKGLWVCALILVAGLIAYGWFLEFNLNLAWTLFASFLIGFGYTSSSIGASTYLVDLAPQSASSITAAANCLKMLLSALITAINTLILDSLGFGWGGTLYAAISFIVVIITFLLVLKGKSIRISTGPELNAHS